MTVVIITLAAFGGFVIGLGFRAAKAGLRLGVRIGVRMGLKAGMQRGIEIGHQRAVQRVREEIDHLIAQGIG